jgi:hypothetical protein
MDASEFYVNFLNPLQVVGFSINVELELDIIR